MKKSHYVFSGFIMLLSMCLFGCMSTYNIVTYDGARLTQDRVANLEFSQNGFIPDPYVKYPRVNVKAVDNREVDNKNDSKWNSNLGPANIELLPGIHSLLIEYFEPYRAGGYSTQRHGNITTSRYVTKSSRSTIAEGTIAFTAEAGHKYVLKVNKRTLGNRVLYCTIVDSTTGGNVVFRTNPFPFSLSEIPNDKAVVCFYRESKMTAGVLPFDIMEDGNIITSLNDNNFYYHVTTSGSHTYSAGVHFADKNSTKLGANDFNLAPGSVSYILLRPKTNLITLEIFLTSVTEKEFLTESGSAD